MTKLILLAVAVVVVVWLLRRAMAGPRAKPPEQTGEKGELVSCAHCGVNLPKGEAHAAGGVPPGAGGRFYCSEEHRKLGPKDG